MKDKTFFFVVFRYELDGCSFADSKWRIILAHPSSTYALLIYNKPKDNSNLLAKFTVPALHTGRESVACERSRLSEWWTTKELGTGQQDKSVGSTKKMDTYCWKRYVSERWLTGEQDTFVSEGWLSIDEQYKPVLTQVNNAHPEPRAGSHHSSGWFVLSEPLIQKRRISSAKLCHGTSMCVNNNATKLFKYTSICRRKLTRICLKIQFLPLSKHRMSRL
jgi:hypothetical protein